MMQMETRERGTSWEALGGWETTEGLMGLEGCTCGTSHTAASRLGTYVQHQIST